MRNTSFFPFFPFQKVSHTFHIIISYGVPPFLRITEALRTFSPTSDFHLGKLSVLFAFIGVLYCIGSNATSALRCAEQCDALAPPPFPG